MATGTLKAATLAVVTLASATAWADDWETPGLDAAHVRLSAERSGALFSAGRWTASFTGGARVVTSPLVADGFVITVDLEGAVRGLRASDGAQLWQVAAGSAVQGTPAIAHGRVFVPTIGSGLVALRIGDGVVLWKRDLGGMTLSSPTPVGEDLLVAGGFPQRSLMRLNGATGETVWQSPAVMEQFSNTSPAVAGGLVVVGSNGGRYYAFDAATGAARWQYAADGIVHLAAPAIVGGRVYMAGGNDSSRVHAVDAETGQAVAGWPIELPSPDPDLKGTRLGRRRAVSSFSAAGGLLLVQTRLDDPMDTDGNGAVDQYLSRETVVALDPASGATVWKQARGRAVFTDPNDVPKLFLCPTPAAFTTTSGALLVATASSLEPTVTVLDVVSGGERARHTVAGVALASPVVANGRLFATAVDGTIQGLSSSVNSAPDAPVPGSRTRFDSADVTLRWAAALDRDGGLPSYEVRLDADGEVLESWQLRMLLQPGITSVPLSTSLIPMVPYRFSVRARDANGAWSDWSEPADFTVELSPPVSVGGNLAKNLTSALDGAQSGDVILLGAGTYVLGDVLRVKPGVSILGAGAGRTVLDAAGLPVGISFEGAPGAHGGKLEGVTVAGADTCIQVASGNTGVKLGRVIVRDCRTEGVAVRTDGGAEIVNATLVGNATGVRAAGVTRIKNSLLARNKLGLDSDGNGMLTSTYNDLFDNQVDYQGLTAGGGDLAKPVSFTDLKGRDLHLVGPQPSTDRGDPADAVGDEPGPNGGRVNLGAFGGTADAEVSAESTTAGGTGAGPDPTSNPRERPPANPSGLGEDGCAVAGRSVPGWSSLLALAAFGLVFGRRRRFK